MRATQVMPFLLSKKYRYRSAYAVAGPVDPFSSYFEQKIRSPAYAGDD
jgi:hypothetical protein